MSKKKTFTAVKLNIEINVLLSEELIEKLKTNSFYIVDDNCFKHSYKKVKSVSHQIIGESPDWGEIINKL